MEKAHRTCKHQVGCVVEVEVVVRRKSFVVRLCMSLWSCTSLTSLDLESGSNDVRLAQLNGGRS